MQRTYKAVCLIAVLWVVVSIPGIAGESSRQWAQSHQDELVSVYRYLHSHPELSFQEENTADRLAAEWQTCGFDVTSGIGGHGVVGLLKNGNGPVLMLRTDLDALPVTEHTGLEFSSRIKTLSDKGGESGVMHACGHDVHMTTLVGVACYLADNKSQWKGTLMLVGQPAEERGAGAKAMLEDGLFERFPKPDFAVALHVSPVLPTGTIGYRPGYAMANVDSVDITVYGKGGHGAYPHTTVDPVVQAAQLVLELQTIVSREVDPVKPAVITVGSIHGGTKYNIIGDSVHLQLTVRSFSDEVRGQLLGAIKRKAHAVALAAAAPEPDVSISEGTPSLYNDPRLVARLDPVLRGLVGGDNIDLSEPSMGGEDFSRYGRAGVPIMMYWLGGVSQQRLDGYKQSGQQPPSLHSALFYPDVEATLVTGVSSMTAIALELLKP